MNQVRPIVGFELADELDIAAVKRIRAHESAAILYGISVAETIRAASANPTAVSGCVLESAGSFDMDAIMCSDKPGSNIDKRRQVHEPGPDAIAEAAETVEENAAVLELVENEIANLFDSSALKDVDRESLKKVLAGSTIVKRNLRHLVETLDKEGAVNGG